MWPERTHLPPQFTIASENLNVIWEILWKTKTNEGGEQEDRLQILQDHEYGRMLTEFYTLISVSELMMRERLTHRYDFLHTGTSDKPLVLNIGMGFVLLTTCEAYVQNGLSMFH